MVTRPRIVLVIDRVRSSLSFESLFERFNAAKCDYHFILLNPGDSELEQVLRKQGHAVTRLNMHSKRDLPRIALQLLWRFIKLRPHVVHAHLLYANITAMPIAWLLGIRKRIYTRHFSTMHWEYHPNFVKWDKLVNRLSTHIIAISPVVREVLIDKENVSPKKITVIPNSFLASRFQNVSSERVDVLRKKYAIPHEAIVIGMISRFIELKGIQYVIDAVTSLVERFPKLCLVLANAKGDYAHVLQAKLERQVAGKFILVKFENDAPALYQLFDVFVHVPVNRLVEAFGQTYCEALTAGVPSIFTLSGIAPAFAKDGENCLVVEYRNADAIAHALEQLITNDETRHKLADAGRKIDPDFTPKTLVALHEKLYC